MIGFFPKRPTGNSAEALFMQWLWDREMERRPGEAQGANTSRTTRGNYTIPGRKGGGPGANAGMVFRGEYDSTATYVVQDVVVLRQGPSAGAYVCVKANPGATNPPTLPDTGSAYWVSIGRADTVGSWS